MITHNTGNVGALLSGLSPTLTHVIGRVQGSKTINMDTYKII